MDIRRKREISYQGQFKYIILIVRVRFNLFAFSNSNELRNTSASFFSHVLFPIIGFVSMANLET